MKQFGWLITLLAFLALMFMAIAVTPLSWARDLHVGGKTIDVLTPSAEFTSGGKVVTGACLLRAIVISTDKTNDLTINVYNGSSSASNKVLPQMPIIGTDGSWGFAPPLPIYCPNGIYVGVSVSGGGTMRGMIYYDLVP